MSVGINNNAVISSPMTTTSNVEVRPVTEFKNQKEFYAFVDQKIIELEQSGLIDKDSANSLREITRPGGDNFLSYSSPMAALVVSMLNLALITQSQVKVESIDIANIKLDAAKELAKELVVNAGLAFGITLVGAGASLALGYNADKILGKPGAKGDDATLDPQSGSWGPVTTNLSFQVTSAASDFLKASGQANQARGQAEIDRIDHILQSFRQEDQELGGQIDRLHQH